MIAHLKRRAVFFFLILYITTITQAEMPFTHIKGLDSITNKEYLSPVHGLVWWQSHLIENLYRYGDSNNATVKLIKELFYLQRDQITFDITTLNRKPAKYFKPSTIGIIFQLLEPYVSQAQLSIDDKQHLQQVLYDAIATNINFANAQKKAEEAVAKIKAEGKTTSEIYKKFVRLTQLNKEKTILQEQLKAKDLSKKEKQALQKQITEKNTELKTLGAKSKLEKAEEVKTITRKIHQEDLTQVSLQELVNLLIDAFDESLRQDIYPAHTFYNILLGFLWQRVEDRQELIPYFESLFSNEKEKSKLINDEKLAQFKTEQTPIIYTKEDYERIKNDLNAVIESENYELAVFGIIASQMWDSPFPPIISSKEATYKTYDFPDCGETSLLNFFNIVLFNQNTSTFDINKLTKPDISLYNQLILFYKNKTYKKVESTSLKSTHDAWANVVSELPEVEYWTPEQNGICEIGTGMNNMMQVINHLLFGHSPNFALKKTSEKLDDIVNTLSRDDFKLEWESNKNVDDPQYDKDSQIKFTINELYHFDWFFQRSHFYITANWTNTTTVNIEKLISSLSSQNTNTLVDLLYLIPLNLEHIKPIMQQINNSQQQNLIFLSHIPRGDDNKIKFIGLVLTKATVTQLSFIEAIINSISNSESYRIVLMIAHDHATKLYYLIPDLYNTTENNISRTNIIHSVIGYNISEFYPLAEKHIKNYGLDGLISPILRNDYFLYKFIDKIKNYSESDHIVSTIAHNHATKLYYLIPDLYNTAKNNILKRNMINSVIANNISEFYPLAEKHIKNYGLDGLISPILRNDYFLYKFIDKIKNYIDTITSELILTSTVMARIIDRKINQLYDTLARNFRRLNEQRRKMVINRIQKMGLTELLELIEKYQKEQAPPTELQQISS